MEEIKFTTTDISKKLKVSDRTVRRYIDKEISKIEGKYLLSEDAFNFIINKYSADNLRTTYGQPADTNSDVENEEFDIIEAFSQEEYLEFQKRLTEYPLLKEKIEESKNRNYSRSLSRSEFIKYNRIWIKSIQNYQSWSK